jgi:hypothetical protein
VTRTAKGNRRAGALTEVEPPEVTRSISPTVRAYKTASGCQVFVAQEVARKQHPTIVLPESALLLWHLSIAHKHRYPTWDEIADVRYALCPEHVTMALLLPPPEKYLNLHEYTFHLWEIDDPRGEAR